MELGFNLSTGLTQKMVLSQRMKLSLQILQMTSGELNRFLEGESRNNVLMKVEWPGGRSGKSYRDEEYDPYMGVGADEPSLYDCLYKQVGEMKIDREMREICEYIIDNIDSRGYLSHWVRHSYDQFAFDRGLEIVRGLEPRGVGADDLKECLLLQLDKGEDCERSIVEYHLEDLAYGNRDAICRSLGINRPRLDRAVRRIKALNPIPARGYRVDCREEKQIPDAYIRIAEEGIEIELNGEAIPRVLIEQAEQPVTNVRYQRYVERCRKRAEFIIGCIRQRQETLERVVRETVKVQEEYLRGGELKPLTLADIGDRLEMHQSTVSRAIKNRYVDIGGKTIGLKKFFAKRFCPKRGGHHTEGVTRNLIKDKLYRIIAEEDKGKPYTDERLVELFRKEGIELARRTIAKYRTEMKIPSSGKRRRSP